MSGTDKARLKTAFEKHRVITPVCTGGPLAVSTDGLRIVTCVGEEAVFTNLADGLQLCRFAGDTETIYSLCLTPSTKHLVMFTASLSLRIYDVPQSNDAEPNPVFPVRTVARAHEAPVHVCKADPTSTYVASGSADGVVKIYDTLRGYVTHMFRGHGGVVSALAFSYPSNPSAAVNEQRTMRLFTASVDNRIRIFDLTSRDSSAKSKPVATLEGHVSVPRGLDVTEDGRWLISGGRDSVVLLWDLRDLDSSDNTKTKNKKSVPTIAKTIPVLERVEAVGLLPTDDSQPGSSRGIPPLQFFCAGEKGVVNVWDMREGRIISTIGKEHVPTDDAEEQRQVVHAVYVPNIDAIVSLHADQNIFVSSLKSHSIQQQVVGFNDEIIDVVHLSPSGSESHLAVAANSSLIRMYSLGLYDSRLLAGHTGVVLCLSAGAGGRLLASGAKDKSARIWACNPERGTWTCVAICEGHAESVGAVALPQGPIIGGMQSNLQVMFTGSQDRTLKMWDISSVPQGPEFDHEGDARSKIVRCRSLASHRAHEKDINSLDISPGDNLLVSGSQDKTAKLFAIEVHSAKDGVRGDIRLLGTFSGHKRGVWSARFGTTDRILVTGSADKTVKLWNIDDFSCVKTFEGHTNSVLRVELFNHDSQIASTASDGLLKVWNVREEECIASMDNHEDKVWALAISADEQHIVTGAADSVVTFWRDCTTDKQHEQENKRVEMALKEQDFLNYVSLNDYRNAISLALMMDQPGRLLSLFKKVSNVGLEEDEPSNSITGHHDVDSILMTLPPTEFAKLLKHVRVWNSTAANSAIAQSVLHALIKNKDSEDVPAAFATEDLVSATKRAKAGLNDIIAALIPYTERHLSRMDRLTQESYVVDYLLGEMDGGILGDDHMEVDI